MPTSTGLPGKNKDDLNVGQRNTDQLTDRLSRSERVGTQDMSPFENSYANDTADDAQENANVEKARNGEHNANGAPQGSWTDGVTGSAAAGAATSAAAAATGTGAVGKQVLDFLFKGKRKAVTGGIGAVGITGIVMAGFLGNIFGLQSLSANLTDNDPATRAIHARFMKNVTTMTSDTETDCKPTTYRCKMKRISYGALASFEKANISAIDRNGNVIDTKQSGYPDRNPSHYDIDMGNGTTERVPAAQLASFLDDNPAQKARLLGVGGIFNPSYRNWTSKYLNKFLDKVGIKKNGGVADGENKKLTNETKRAAIKEKVTKLIPSFNSATAGGSTIASRIGDLTSKKVGRVAVALGIWRRSRDVSVLKCRCILPRVLPQYKWRSYFRLLMTLFYRLPQKPQRVVATQMSNLPQKIWKWR
ncbi:hypothetical protein B7Z17_03255 [Candidatus Saccharibacteria bacterium 32-49-10]|nr:MAG: hypothetical protein B7Z17_03255 [Candidatus Saccharibacteria bacterium 32-49-10]